MTSYSQILAGKQRTNFNKKDGPGQRKAKSLASQFETAGFTLIEPPAKWYYTWQGTFPIFTVKPGRVNGLTGLVARHEQSCTVEWFPYGTDPAEIKTRLDELILEIVRHDAGLAEAPLFEIDVDDIMAEWLEVNANANA